MDIFEIQCQMIGTGFKEGLGHQWDLLILEQYTSEHLLLEGVARRKAPKRWAAGPDDLP